MEDTEFYWSCDDNEDDDRAKSPIVETSFMFGIAEVVQSHILMRFYCARSGSIIIIFSLHTLHSSTCVQGLAWLDRSKLVWMDRSKFRLGDSKETLC